LNVSNQMFFERLLVPCLDIYLHYLTSSDFKLQVPVTVHRERSVKRKKTKKFNNKKFIINFCLKIFRASLCPSSGEQRPCYCIWCTALVLLYAVGSVCGALLCRMREVLPKISATASWIIQFSIPGGRTYSKLIV